MRVRWIDSEEKTYWDAIINEYSNSEVYHLFEWTEMIQKTYKVKAFRLIVEDSGRTCVALPFIFFKNPIIGRKLVSLPFCDYGGFCGDLNRQEAILFMLQETIRLAHSLGAKFMELRMLAQNRWNMEKTGFNLYYTALTYRLRTNGSYDEILRQYDKKVRNDIRKAEREGLKVYEATKKDDLGTFFRLYLKRMLELGTPPAPKSFWINLWNYFYPQRLRLIFTMKEDMPIAACMALIYKKRLYLLLNVSDSKWWGLRGLNDILFDWYIRFACEKELQEVDFGRTRYGTGVMKFKEKGWGGIPIEVHKYYYFLRGNENPVDRSIQSSIYAKVWRRFVPRAASPALGYIIRKNVGDA